ncbi:MAG TPA: Uma2 family endonuclease, partial [Phototrophicaceae bacterium]|nr:Uma2 family endonuclease [Phototrophicaceae bacterium]
MALREKLYTAEEFFEIASLPENDDKRLELDDGEIVEMAESSAPNSVTAMRIGTFINVFVMSHNSGYVTGADGGFKLGERRVRQPDVGFISKERLPKLPKRIGIAPDLAVEIVSPDEDIFKKAREYLHAGTRMVWAVYTGEKTVHVMKLDEDGGLRSQPFGIGAVLDGGDVLPGFTLAVKDIFPD